MTKQIQVFVCGNPRDHKCDDLGASVVFRDDGTTELELEARKRPDFPKGLNGGSVTCSVCGLDAATRDMWRDE